MSYLLKTRRSEPTLQKPMSSEEQQQKINEVRELLGDLPSEMPRFLSDSTIRRFLRARNWSPVQAAKTLKEAVKWRRQYKPDKIRWEDIAEKENEVKRAYIPEYLDNNGRAVFVLIPSIKSLTSEKNCLKQLVYNLETLAMSSEGALEENVVCVVDFRGWTLSNTPLVETRESLHVIQRYYPGLIAVAILCNPPRIFESFWKIVNYFIEPRMKEKVKFVYTNNSESQKTMADMIDLDKLESAFGGRNTSGVDIVKYAERMLRRDKIRGASTHANDNTSSS
ncbi:SEC14 cytosolic factor-like [Phragmites australis]|uniref:SEC14 cytosolic factor-like n=1 Tax=Phragmites australis TaxID=29695 RepID=UPI002D775A2D|nr:SEC14 cytosolic factor-like [Phragmites australis]